MPSGLFVSLASLNESFMESLMTLNIITFTDMTRREEDGVSCHSYLVFSLDNCVYETSIEIGLSTVHLDSVAFVGHFSCFPDLTFQHVAAASFSFVSGAAPTTCHAIAPSLVAYAAESVSTAPKTRC